MFTYISFQKYNATIILEYYLKNKCARAFIFHQDGDKTTYNYDVHKVFLILYIKSLLKWLCKV